MSYRLDLGAPVPDALRAVLVERLEHAHGALRDADPDDAAAAKAVHSARKDIKKARALLRLARPDLDEATYRRENDALRDIARSLTAAREADVLAATFELVVPAADRPDARARGQRAARARRGDRGVAATGADRRRRGGLRADRRRAGRGRRHAPARSISRTATPTR